MVAPGTTNSADSSLLPLWEKVARINRCATDEGSVSACSWRESRARRQTPHPASRSAKRPSPTRGEGAPSPVAEGIGIAVDRRRAAEMGVEDLRSLREISLVHEIDHALHGFPLIDGIGDHAFEPRTEPDRFLGFL